MLVGAAFHEHAIEDGRHVPGVFGRSEQTIDEPGTLVGALVGEKRTGLGRGWDRAGKIEGDAAQELGVAGERCGLRREIRPRADLRIDALMQRLRATTNGDSVRRAMAEKIGEAGRMAESSGGLAGGMNKAAGGKA